jgi:hypothetical protein
MTAGFFLRCSIFSCGSTSSRSIAARWLPPLLGGCSKFGSGSGLNFPLYRKQVERSPTKVPYLARAEQVLLFSSLLLDEFDQEIRLWH